jgi:hypothetical protein
VGQLHVFLETIGEPTEGGGVGRESQGILGNQAFAADRAFGRAGSEAKLLKGAQSVRVSVERVGTGHLGMNPLSAK